MRVLILICLPLLACGKQSDAGDTGTNSTSVALEGGIYLIESAINTNGCGEWGPNFNESIDGFELEISFPESDTARFHWQNVQDCPKNVDRVVCETEAPLVLDDYTPENDVVIMYEDRTDLTWDSATTASGPWIVNLSCEGSQCDLFAEVNDETYPCSIEMDWTLSLQE